jgi:hypothetical protein
MSVTQNARADTKSWLDTWLPRISHLCQVGLLIAAVVGYYLTVVPLYQKALLEEAISKREIELRNAERSLVQIRKQYRSQFVRQSAGYLGAECSGALVPVRLPSEALGKAPDVRTREVEAEAEAALVVDCENATAEYFARVRDAIDLPESDRRELEAAFMSTAVEVNKRRRVDHERFRAAWRTGERQRGELAAYFSPS